MSRSVLRRLLSVTALFIVVQMASGAAEAANRLALVIGQSAYRDVVQLPNTANDARRMAELLSSAGFTVTTAADLSQNDLRQTIADFAGKVAASGPETIVAVFYAGHGLQVDGENFLLPVDIDPKRESDIPLQAVRLNDVMNTLGALPTLMRIYMLDACRNNPFPALSGSAGHGLAMVDTKAGASGSFVSFSTSPGAEAEDGSGSNSPYTTALLSVATQPIPIEEAFKRVRVAVNQETQGRQVPWESSSLTADFRFFGSEQSAAQGQPASADGTRKPAGTTRSVAEWRKDLDGKDVGAAYDLVIAANTIEAYEAFVALFNAPPYASRVAFLLERRKEMVAWYSAVAINTAASFQIFLGTYPKSDLAPTAQKLMERVRNRSLDTNAAMLSPGGLAALTPGGGGQSGGPGAQKSNPPQPLNTSLGPTCPCGPVIIPPVIKKNVDTSPPKKRADTPPPRKKGIRPPTDEDIAASGQAAGPPPSGPPPGAIIGPMIGGVIIGGGMRREPGPVYHPPPVVRGGSYQNYR